MKTENLITSTLAIGSQIKKMQRDKPKQRYSSTQSILRQHDKTFLLAFFS
jgi:hypothetical protein